MSKVLAITGNSACAQAMRQINPDVVAAYPITPQTAAVEEFSAFVADGLVDTEYFNVESEHSAMSACVGAAAAGARVMTTTSSQGLALMWEVLYIASAMRLPIVMYNANRALSGPINIHCDHSDSLGARDSGWLQIYSENAQETYDNMIQAIKIGESSEVQLPVMVMQDGFIISHAIDRVELLEDDEVQGFVGEREPKYTLLDPDNPITAGPFDGLHGFYFEHKKAQEVAMKEAEEVILRVGREFGELTGRSYSFFEEYRMDDAEVAVVIMGSAAGTAKDVVDEMRAEGTAAGLVKLRVFRPFPTGELARVLGKLKAVSVMDRADSLGGAGSPVFVETRAALYALEERPPVVNHVYGLGGREVGLADIKSVFSELEEIAGGRVVKTSQTYLGLRE